MTLTRPFRFVISCEHGGNEVPQRYADLFDSPGAKCWLNSHRGYDPGALAATWQIAAYLNTRDMLFCDPVIATTTRLLVDLNRSIDNPSLWSKFTLEQPQSVHNQILSEFYEPHRRAVESLVDEIIKNGEVAIHLSVHTFTSRIRRKWRPLEIGLLFDPQRCLEADFCQQWSVDYDAKSSAPKRHRLRSNEPYAGTDDGLTTRLRRVFPATSYCGIEIEINNRFYRKSPDHQAKLVARLCDAMPWISASTGPPA